MGVYERGSSEALYSQTATATDGLALVTLKAEFLKSGSACCMTPGTEYEIRYSQGETTYRFPYPSRFSKVYGNTCTIRLGVALVNGKPRTRIVLYKVLSGA